MRNGINQRAASADVPPEVFPWVHATGATKLAVDHLLSLGLTHFAYVGHRGRLGSRLLGENFRRALASRGHTLLIHEIETLPTAGLAALETTAAAERGLVRFLDKAPKRLGVLAIDDYFARVVCLVCRQLGLEVPGDVAVLGIEDTMQARTFDPPLSTIRPPGEEVGYRAMHLLHSMLRGKLAPRTGETCLQIAQTPKDERERRKNLQKVNGIYCGGGRWC